MGRTGGTKDAMCPQESFMTVYSKWLNYLVLTEILFEVRLEFTLTGFLSLLSFL